MHRLLWMCLDALPYTEVYCIIWTCLYTRAYVVLYGVCFMGCVYRRSMSVKVFLCIYRGVRLYGVCVKMYYGWVRLPVGGCRCEVAWVCVKRCSIGGECFLPVGVWVLGCMESVCKDVLWMVTASCG